MMKVLLLLTVVLPCVPLTLCSEGTGYYVAAVVEFSPEVDYLDPLAQTVLNNLLKYEELIATAKSQGVDIIVFPEDGLVSMNLYEVPHPRDAVSPCLHPSKWEGPMYRLSCAARNNEIYVAFNLYEKNEEKSYITNVVFDRNGFVVSRYRKIHLFNEDAFNYPEDKDFGVFHTDFGVTFGVAICFDLLYREPATTLVQTRNIRHFVFSTTWISEMPFLTAVQFQAAWAWSHNSVLLASGTSFPDTGSFGSGIFAGRLGPITTLLSDEKTTQLLIGRVPKNLDVKDGAYATQYRKEMESTGTSFDNFFLLKDSMKEFSSKLLPLGYAEKDTKLCHRGFCCQFNIQTAGKESQTTMNWQPYRLVVWSGVREFSCGVTGGVQFCGVVACRDATDVKSCAYPIPANRFRKVEFSKLQIRGEFEARNTLTLANTMNLNLLPLPADTFNLTENANHKTMVLTEKREDIHTFAIYNRVLDWDRG